MDLFRASTVADYLFDKDVLFARLNLSDDEFALYQNIYHNLAPQVPAPDLVSDPVPARLAARLCVLP